VCPVASGSRQVAGELAGHAVGGFSGELYRGGLAGAFRVGGLHVGDGCLCQLGTAVRDLGRAQLWPGLGSGQLCMYMALQRGDAVEPG
jgi:hypothetical protein